MTTKQEYIDILGQMEELYYNSDNCTLAMNLFKEDINLLTGLVNGEPKSCIDTNCGECDFKDSGECVKRVREWLNQQYKKPTYKLNKFEYDLINTFDRCKECCLLNEIECLKKLIEKGYFKGIDPFTKVHDIIDNCEVIE